MKRLGVASFGVLVALTLGVTVERARADVGVPPWTGLGDLPIPKWAKSVAPQRGDVAIYSLPDRAEPRRGTLERLGRPPLYGAARGPGCNGRWLQIGPAAWTCSDDVDLAADDPAPPKRGTLLPPRYTDDGLPFHYAFVGPEGATGYRNLDLAGEAAPDADFDPGFAVAIVEEGDAHGERWGKTSHGSWIALRELNAVRPQTLHGDVLSEADGANVGWVLPDHAPTYADAKATKAASLKLRFTMVHVREETKLPGGTMVRVSDDGAPAPEWMRARDLARPTIATPPDEVGGKDATERWIDVQISTQTLLAYEGTRPVYAALVATGRGAQGTETATPIGVHRIWVKLRTSTMGNLGDEDAESHYQIEDVPYVQFFAKGVALHGAFWHHSFGSAHSHGCVNLTPVDARWLFDFTGPRLPEGWSAVLPAKVIDRGTYVRVRG